MAEGDAFFSRWSRRKAAVAKGVVLDEPAPVAPSLAAEQPSALKTALKTAPQGHADAARTDPATPAVTPAPEAPPLTLEDAQALTLDSDFKPFMARSVSPQVKNAAMKKLFTDPHYQVMDRLDIYIDDYNTPDPLPAAMLRQMASAQFLKLFDDDAIDPTQATLAGDTAGIPDTHVATNLPESPPASVCPASSSSFASPAIPQPLNPDQTHAHADLRLQPHDAAVDPQTGPPAGPGGQ